MNQLHIKLDENSSAMQWANSQTDKLGARGHIGTHLDCYTIAPEKNEYEVKGLILDCRTSMPKPEDILHIDSLENMALVLHTGNSEKHQYGTEDYFNEATFLSEEVLNLILIKKPLFIIVDSHGIAEKGAKHISYDKKCEANGCHVIENVDLTSVKDKKSIQIKISINASHPSTGKPLNCIVCNYFKMLWSY